MKTRLTRGRENAPATACQRPRGTDTTPAHIKEEENVMLSISEQDDTRNEATLDSAAVTRWHQAIATTRRTVAPDERDPAARACAPWCSQAAADAAGHVTHPAAADPADRACCSEPAAVALAHHRGALSLEPGAGICLAVVEVALTQRHDAAAPVVEVDVHSWHFVPGAGDVAVGSEPLCLRPTEARALAALLVLAADAATAGGVR